MKKLIEFLKQQPNKEYECAGVKFGLQNDNKVGVSNEDMTDFASFAEDDDLYFIRDFCMEFLDAEIRFCNCCGCPMCECFMDCCDFYCCSDCFEEYMDEVYGANRWTSTEDEGESGGFYEYVDADGDWLDSGIFWTEL